MFRCILAATLSGLLFGCGGGGDGGNLTNSVTGPSTVDISKACPTDMECTYFKAPKDYANPNGETVNVHYAVHKATDLQNRIGILVFNFGGPGAEAVDGTNWMVKNNLPSEILAKFDIIGMDPRGAGQSVYAQELTDCAVAASKSQGNCDSLYESIAPFVGSNSVVKDLEQLRITLGEDKLNFFGYSYGTRLGSLYAEMYPENVRAIVLDSPMAPNEDNYFESFKGKVEGFKTVLQYRLGADYITFENIIRTTRREGIYTGSDGVELTESELTEVLWATISRQNMGNWSKIKTGLFELLNNDNANLLKSQQKKIEWPKETNDSLRSNKLFQLVSCTDEALPLSQADIYNKGYEYTLISPLFADYAKKQSQLCGYWPIQRDPIAKVQAMENILTDQQILIIAGKYDTNTHYVWGQEMATAFGDLAAFISVDQLVDHGFSYTGLSCVDKSTTQYLLDPTIKIANQTCSPDPQQRKATLNEQFKEHPVHRANPVKH